MRLEPGVEHIKQHINREYFERIILPHFDEPITYQSVDIYPLAVEIKADLKAKQAGRKFSVFPVNGEGECDARWLGRNDHFRVSFHVVDRQGELGAIDCLLTVYRTICHLSSIPSAQLVGQIVSWFEELGGGDLFPTIYDGKTWENALLREYLDWPTLSEVARKLNRAINEQIDGTKHYLEQELARRRSIVKPVYHVPPLAKAMESYTRLEVLVHHRCSLIDALVTAIAKFHAYGEIILAKARSAGVEIFEPTADHYAEKITGNLADIARWQKIPKETIQETLSDEYREALRAIAAECMTNPKTNTLIVGDCKHENILVFGDNETWQVKFIDLESVRVASVGLDLAEIFRTYPMYNPNLDENLTQLKNLINQLNFLPF